jgi:transposase
MVTPVVSVFLQGLSRSAAAANELLGAAFAGTVVSDRFSAFNHCRSAICSCAGLT